MFNQDDNFDLIALNTNSNKSNGVLLNKPDTRLLIATQQVFGAAVCSNMEGSTTAEEKGMDMQFNTSIRLLIPTGINE